MHCPIKTFQSFTITLGVKYKPLLSLGKSGRPALPLPLGAPPLPLCLQPHWPSGCFWNKPNSFLTQVLEFIFQISVLLALLLPHQKNIILIPSFSLLLSCFNFFVELFLLIIQNYIIHLHTCLQSLSQLEQFLVLQPLHYSHHIHLTPPLPLG